MFAVMAMWLALAPGAAAPVELRWDAPVGCPTEAELRTGVEALLGESLTRPRPRRMTVIATVQARAPGWSLRIFTITGEGTRERALRYERECEVLTRAATVLIAMVIDPDVLGRLDPESLALAMPAGEVVPGAGVEGAAVPGAGSEAGPRVGSAAAVAVGAKDAAASAGPVPQKDAAASAGPVPQKDAAAGPLDAVSADAADPSRTPVARPAGSGLPRRSRVRPRGGVRVLGGLGWNDLPAVGGGVGVVGSVLFERVRIELGGALWPVRRVRVASMASGADFLLWTVGARACPRLRPRPRLELPLCAGFEAGQVQVRGVRLVDGTDARTPWFAFVVAPALAVELTPVVALWLAAELAVPVLRTEFRVDAGAIHRAGAVALRGVLGLEFRFPRGSAMERRGIGNQGRGRP